MLTSSQGVRATTRSITLSVAAHVLLLLLCFLALSYRTAHPPAPRSISIVLDSENIDALKHLKDKKDESTRNQIVQTAPGHRVEHAAPDAFLGDKNQVVDRQTVGQKHLTEMGSTPQAAHPAAPKSDAARTAESAVKSRDAVKSPVLSQLGVAIIPSAEKAQEAAARESDPQWAHFGSLPQDYVKGFKDADQTMLNTKEYVFYGYFQRIRERLDRAWVPILRERLTKLWRTGRQLANDMDHTTQVLVVLNKEGEIVHVQIVSESGTHDLDEAAVNAFNRAGPFPNPPKGIIDAKGEIEIPWQFILKT